MRYCYQGLRTVIIPDATRQSDGRELAEAIPFNMAERVLLVNLRCDVGRREIDRVL